MSGEYEAKEEYMTMYFAKTQEFIKQLAQFSITHILGSENQQADALARMTRSAEGSAPRNIMWEVLCQPSINAKEQLALNWSSTWIRSSEAYEGREITRGSKESRAD